MAAIEAIETVYLEADAASVTFSAIPATYEHLEFRGSVRSTRASTTDNIHLTYNGVTTGTAYSSHEIAAEGSSAWAGKRTGNAYILFPYNPSAATEPAADYSGFTWTILDYAEDGNKNATGMGISTGGSGSYLVFTSGLWDSTDDITSVTFTPNIGSFTRGSEFSLYGLNSS